MYNQLTRKLTAHVRNKARLALTGRFASMVGFDKKEVMITKNTEAPLPVDLDLEAGFRAMYLYTDIVEPQLVGDIKVSLVKVVKCSGEFGDNVNLNFPKSSIRPSECKVV